MVAVESVTTAVESATTAVVSALTAVESVATASVFPDPQAANTNATAITNIQAVDLTQNTNISNLQTWLDANNTLQSSINTSQNTRLSTVEANTIYISGVDATQNTNIGLAWNTANNALANTDGVRTAGSLTVTGAFYAANTIRTPTIYPGSQTSITLSFTNSALEKVNTATGLTVTLSNFIPGKFIDLYVTNVDNSQHTITHGCSALNSSMGATSFNLAASRTAYLRYASLDGDLANTFVTATYN